MTQIINTPGHQPSGLYDAMIARWKASDLAGDESAVTMWPDNTGHGWSMHTPGEAQSARPSVAP